MTTNSVSPAGYPNPRPTYYPIGHWPFKVNWDHRYHVVRKVDPPIKYFANDTEDRLTDWAFLCTGQGATYDYRAPLSSVTCKDCLKLVQLTQEEA